MFPIWKEVDLNRVCTRRSTVRSLLLLWGFPASTNPSRNILLQKFISKNLADILDSGTINFFYPAAIKYVKIENNAFSFVVNFHTYQIWHKFCPCGACIIKLITAVIYGFHNKLECLSLNTRLGWKSSPRTNT